MKNLFLDNYHEVLGQENMIFKDYMDLVLLEKIKSESTEPLLIVSFVNLFLM